MKKIKTLVVDDSMITRNHIIRIMNKMPQLQLNGIARNGIEAIKAIHSNMPDLITMDLTMPELDGVATIKQIMKLNPDVLILVISALSDKETAIEALELGAVGFLYKPFSEEQLMESIEEVLKD